MAAPFLYSLSSGHSDGSLVRKPELNFMASNSATDALDAKSASFKIATDVVVGTAARVKESHSPFWFQLEAQNLTLIHQR